MSVESWEIAFGVDGRFRLPRAGTGQAPEFSPPRALADPEAAVAAACAQPVDSPPLARCATAGDRVVLALDRGAPCAEAIVGGVWRQLESAGVSPEQLLILQPAELGAERPGDPRAALPTAARSACEWRLHDPLESAHCSYLASTASGERIYLARELIDADLVILAGSVGFDPLWGYRGLQSLLYPGCSTVEALRKAHGQPHVELRTRDARPLRQQADEVAWLLGASFAVAVTPGARGGIGGVCAGLPDSTLRTAMSTLDSQWRFAPGEPAELVLVAVDAAPPGQGWAQLAAALSSACRWTPKNGRIGVLSQLDGCLTPGLQLLRAVRTPRDAFRPLREQAPPDLLAASELARALDWANIYLLSRLDPDLVEDLFMVPLLNLDEVARLVQAEESCVVIRSAQFVCTEPL